MFQRLSRIGRAVIVVVVLGALGGQQVSAEWICLPPAFSCLAWLFSIGTLVHTLQDQSRASLFPPDTEQSTEPTPPLCLTGPVPVSVWAEPVRKEVQISQSITVKIYGDFSQPVMSFGLHLDYDSALLGLQQLKLAPAFHPLHSNYTDGVAGLAYPSGVSGDRVLLATARFTTTGIGDADIGLAVTPNDPTEGFALSGVCGSQATLTPTTVTIIQREPPPPRPPPPVPEPGSVLLVLTGTSLLRRRRGAR
jgi:hypothetical protein